MTGADGISQFLSSFSQGRLTVRYELCSRIRHRAGCCTLCEQACGRDAISIGDGGGSIAIDSTLCVYCGNCASACPTGAIEVGEPSTEELVDAAIEAAAPDGSVMFSCERCIPKKGWDTSRIAAVPCLGRIDEPILVKLEAAGIDDVRMYSGGCAECEERAGRDLADLAADSACCLLECFGRKLSAKMFEEMPDEYLAKEKRQRKARADGAGALQARGESRRGFIEHAGDSVKALAASQAPQAISSAFGALDNGEGGSFANARKHAADSIETLQVADDGGMPQRPDSRRESVLCSLEELGMPSCDHAITSFFGSVSIDGSMCSGCGMCATFCPTGALAHAMRDNERCIMYTARRCTGCHLCEQVCPSDAIEVSEEVSLSEMLSNSQVCATTEVLDERERPFGYFTIALEEGAARSREKARS